MPLYEYECKKCSRTFELLVLSTTVPQCSNCGSKALQRLISAPTAPGKSVGIMARGRVRAEKEGHLCNFKRSNGRLVD